MKCFFPKDRVLILDGAMGTMLQKHGLTGQGQDYNLSAPETVASIHQEYIDAGADIIETNTFSGGYETSLAGASIARSVADKAGRKVYVAGSIGPKTKSLSICNDYEYLDRRAASFDEMSEEYSEQIRGLQDGGVDLLLIETCFDALNAKAAIYAWDRLGRKVPVMVSGTFSDGSGRLLTGQSLEAFYTSIRHCDPVAFGLNCGLGAEKMMPFIQEIGRFAECPVICYPNAGMPDESGAYDQSPEDMAGYMRKLAETGIISIAGGCCGSTPDHIRAIAQAVKGLKPAGNGSYDSALHVSGLEDIKIDKADSVFTNTGSRTNAVVNPDFAKLISEDNFDEAMITASGQVEDGANIININMDDAMLDSTVEMGRFVRYLMSDPSVSRAALMIDSSHFETILEGLKNSQGKCIANCISLKDGDNAFVEKALQIRALGAAMVVKVPDVESQARAYGLLTGAGIEPSDIIFDKEDLSAGTGMQQIDDSIASEPCAYPPEEYLTPALLGDQDIAVREIPVGELAQHIDWKAFLSIIGLKDSEWSNPGVRNLLNNARESLLRMDCKVYAGVHFVPAGTVSGDMPLRQFLKPESPLGLFAAAIHAGHPSGCTCFACQDPSQQALRLCLADAASRWIGQHLTLPDGFKCILPGAGSTSCPDISLRKEILARIPDAGKLGITLTDTCAMAPDSSICGFVIMHKSAKYL